MRRLFFSVMILSSLLVGLDSCKKGDQGPIGPAGPTGAAGAPGAPGAAGAAGAKGADGTKILSGTTAPTDATGAINDFYLNTSTGILYGPKQGSTAPGTWTGAPQTTLKGANGATGATGAAGATGPQGATGATGANGTNFLAGPANPTAAQGANGDYYFNTTDSKLFGPKAAGAWPATGIAIGVTATPRVFFLDVKLDGTVISGTTINTWSDTALEIDPTKYVQSSYALNRIDVEQRIAGYPGWSAMNGREVMFTDISLTPTGQYLMVPTENGDFESAPGTPNTIGRQFVYTNDPKNAKYMAIIRRAGQIAGNVMTTNPANPLPGTAQPNPVPVSTSGVPFAGGGLRYGNLAPAITSANIAQAITDLGLTAADATPVQQFTFSLDDYNRLTSSPTAGPGATYNALCYWMYAEAAHSTGTSTPSIGNKSFVIDGLVDFFYVWQKKAKTPNVPFSDYDVKKTYNFNDGNFYRNTTLDAAGSAQIAALSAAWSASRATGSIDLHYMYATPAGHAATGAMASQTSIGPAVTTDVAQTITVPGVAVVSGQRAYQPGSVSTVGAWTQNTMAYNAPVVTPFYGGEYYALQNLYNTWISLNDAGASWNTGSHTGNPGTSFGSGPANDYNTQNGAHGHVYFLTPMAYEFGTFAAYNGGGAFSVASAYGTYTVPAAPTTTAYPYTGIWLQNGVLQVNYRVYNGGTTLRNVTLVPAPLVFNGTSGANAYTYNWTGPKGYIGAPGSPASNYWSNALAGQGGSYADGPWPANQNTACQGYYFDGKFIPVGVDRATDYIIKLKIQTIPSNNPADPPIQLNQK